MTRQERILKKAQLYVRLSCFDHHKTRDGRFCVEKTYCAWTGKVRYYPYHNGYIDDWDTTKDYGTEEEAEDALEEFIDSILEGQFEWHLDNQDEGQDINGWELVSPFTNKKLGDLKRELDEINS